MFAKTFEKTLRHVAVVNDIVYDVNIAYSISNAEYENSSTRYKVSNDFSDELAERTGFFLSEAEIFNFQEFPDPNKPGNMMIVQTWRVRVPSHHWKSFNEWLEKISNTPTETRGWFRRWLDNKFMTVSEKDNPFELIQ